MAFPSDLVRTKTWSSEVLTSTDLNSQYDLIISWIMAAFNSSTGHTHSGSGNNGPLLSSSAVTTTFGNGFTTVTAASGDYVLLATDVSDSNKTKKALVSDIVTLAAPVAATQAEMEAASSTSVMATPGRTQYHPGVAKVVVNFDGTASSPITPGFNYGVSGTVTKNGTGDYTVNFSTNFSATTYVPIFFCRNAAIPVFTSVETTYTKNVGSIRFTTNRRDNGSAIDSEVNLAIFGDQ